MSIPQLLVHDKKDTVGVVAVEGLKAGTDMLCVVTADNSSFNLKSKMDVPIGHKIALTDIKKGDTVLEIRPGHRQGGGRHRQGRACPRPQSQDQAVVVMAQSNGKSNMKFMGWRRENGRVGVRNHVLILPLDDLSNAACEAVANNIKGTLAMPHAYGRLQFGEDLELFFRTIIGTGANPNVAAVVVIGIEEGWTKRVVDGIEKTGKPVTGFGIELHGDIDTIATASRVAKEYVQWASELQREECDISDLWVSTKCGESDTTTGLASCPTVGNMYDKLIPKGIYGVFGETSEITGAEHLAKARAISPEIGEKWMKTWQAYEDEVIQAHKTDDLSDSQPTKGNIAGGLTTIEEKALGNLEKIGRTCKYIDVLEPAEAPAKGAGPLLHGHLVGRGGMRDADGGGRLCGAHLPDRPGQHHRQPDRAGDQDHRQSAHRAHHVRACRRRRVRHPAPRHDDPGGRRRADRDDPAHRERPADRGRGARATASSC